LSERLRFELTEVDEGAQDNLLTGLHLVEKPHAQLEATLPVIADYGDLFFFSQETAQVIVPGLQWRLTSSRPHRSTR
jgi:hypothetical protein